MKHHSLAIVAVLLCVGAAYLGAGRVMAGGETVSVATASGGANAVEFLGHALQNGDSIDSFGYFTHVSGLSDALLFKSGASARTGSVRVLRGAPTARFTYVSTGSVTGRFVETPMIVDTFRERLTVYFQKTPHGDWTAPSSFKSADPIATYSMRFQDMLNVQAPNVGIETGAAGARQTGATTFMLTGHALRFGRTGAAIRFTTFGEGRRTQVTPVSKSTFVVAGNGFVVH